MTTHSIGFEHCQRAAHRQVRIVGELRIVIFQPINIMHDVRDGFNWRWEAEWDSLGWYWGKRGGK